jgi:hypothetical protein
MTSLYKIELSKRLMQVNIWDFSVVSTLPKVSYDLTQQGTVELREKLMQVKIWDF